MASNQDSDLWALAQFVFQLHQDPGRVYVDPGDVLGQTAIMANVFIVYAYLYTMGTKIYNQCGVDDPLPALDQLRPGTAEWVAQRMTSALGVVPTMTVLPEGPDPRHPERHCYHLVPDDMTACHVDDVWLGVRITMRPADPTSVERAGCVPLL